MAIERKAFLEPDSKRVAVTPKVPTTQLKPSVIKSSVGAVLSKPDVLSAVPPKSVPGTAAKLVALPPSPVEFANPSVIANIPYSKPHVPKPVTNVFDKQVTSEAVASSIKNASADNFSSSSVKKPKMANGNFWNQLGSSLDKVGNAAVATKKVVDTVQSIGIKNNTAGGIGINQPASGVIDPRFVAYTDKNVQADVNAGAAKEFLTSPIFLLLGGVLLLKVLKVF